MSKLEDGSIYEFIDNLFLELIQKDGGYFPSKHDSDVFLKASERFGKSVLEVERIFNSFASIAARKEVQNLNKLPKKKKEEKRKEMLINILKNNRDLPYHDIEGPASEPIKSGFEILNNEYKGIAVDIGLNGWTLPMSMGLSELDVLVTMEKSNKTYDGFFSKYYSNKKFRLMIKHVNLSSISQRHKELFNDCINAYEEKRYLICITALLTLLEGILSCFGDTKTDIRMMRICRFNMDSTESNKKIINHLIWVSFFNFISTLYEKSNFDQDEPAKINRHWILHGRTDTDWTDADALRLFSAVYSLTTILKYEN